MGKIATRQDCNSILSGVLTSNLNGCPTYQEIVVTGKLKIKGSYSQSQLVQLSDISKIGKLIFTSTNKGSYNIYRYGGSYDSSKPLFGPGQFELYEGVALSENYPFSNGMPLTIKFSDGTTQSVADSQNYDGNTITVNVNVSQQVQISWNKSGNVSINQIGSTTYNSSKLFSKYQTISVNDSLSSGPPFRLGVATNFVWSDGTYYTFSADKVYNGAQLYAPI